MRRLSAVLAAGVVCACALGGTVGAQESPDTTVPETTTTTTTAAPPTSAAPAPAPPAPAPAATATTTTTVPETTTTTSTTTTTIAPEPVVVPGERITSGSLALEVGFKDTPAASCTTNVDLAGGQVNAVRDGGGNVAGVYGIAPSGTGTAGVFMIGLGAMPVGVGIVSISNGTCELDAIGLGAFTADAGSAGIEGVAVGMHPGNYERGEYINTFGVRATIGATAAPATLDAAAVQAFLYRNRPGLSITPPVPDTTTTSTPAG